MYFGKKIMPKKFYLPSPAFHKEIASLMMDRSITQLLIQAPRGFAKSTFAIIFTLHHCIFDKGDKMVIIQSKTRNEAIARLGTIKNVMDYGSTFKRLFGYAGEEVAEVWREDRIKTKIGGSTITIRAIGTGQPMRGALESGVEESNDQDTEITDTRITLYFLEDPDDEDNTATEERMDKNWSKFIGSKEGLDKRNGRVLAIGTPITRGCIVDRIHSNPVGWVSKIYQAEWEDEEGKKIYLWEAMRNAEWLANKKAELVAAGKLSKYYSEYLCQLKKGEDVFFKGYHTYKGHIFWEDELAFLKVTRIDGSELPEPKIISINTFVGIDPASSDNLTASVFSNILIYSIMDFIIESITFNT